MFKPVFRYDNGEYVKVDEDNLFRWRLTPWDTKVFGFKTAEILEIKFDRRLLDIFQLIDEIVRTNGIRFLYYRHDANDHYFKREALLNGFYIPEHSVYVYHPDISRITRPAYILDFQKVTEYDSDEIEQVSIMARNGFIHGRFHEDPFIKKAQACERYAVWASELVRTSNLYIFYRHGIPGGFFAYNLDREWIDIILVGLSDSMRGKGMGNLFWTSMLAHIWHTENRGKLRSLMSTSNTNAVNLYAQLGFSFANPRFGYHKWY